jgi:hypothetical protein
VQGIVAAASGPTACSWIIAVTTPARSGWQAFFAGKGLATQISGLGRELERAPGKEGRQ